MYQSQLDILLLEKKFVKFIVSLDLLFYTENLTIDKNPNYCVLFTIFLFKNKNKIILDFEYSFCIKKLKWNNSLGDNQKSQGELELEIKRFQALNPSWRTC